MEERPEQQAPYTPPNRKDKTPLFIGIVVALLGVLVFFYYLNSNLQEERDQQARELSSTLLQLDSISYQLDQKIQTISELGGEVDTLLAIRAQLEEEKKELLTKQDKQQELVKSLKDRVDGYQELLLAKDKEIEQLQRVNKELVTENVELKSEKKQLSRSIEEIAKQKEELADKVAFASRLKIDGLKVYAVNSSGKERVDEFRNRHIDKLKVTFNVVENKVAPIEGKELLVRIVAPDGNVLFDVTRGSGSFIYESREMFYTAKQEILYDKKNQTVTLFYEKGSEFDEGNYDVEVYTEDYLMGKGGFIVK